MKCPECGSKKTLKMSDGSYICECGHQWKDIGLTVIEQIEQSQTPEEFAEIFVFQGFGWLWHCYLFEGAWCDKQNAVAAVLSYFKQKLGVE